MKNKRQGQNITQLLDLCKNMSTRLEEAHHRINNLERIIAHVKPETNYGRVDASIIQGGLFESLDVEEVWAGDELLWDPDQVATKEPVDKLPSNNKKESLVSNTTDNNGGRTSYYDIPKGAVTLDDLIAHKDMPFWRGDAFKALYALQERARKGPTSSEIRELNKVVYDCTTQINRLINKK